MRWRNEAATFHSQAPTDSSVPMLHALVFAFYGDKIVLAEIPGRGWCIPSGRIEAGETPEQTARREAFEEAGATLSRVVPLGYFVFTDSEKRTVRYAPAFVGEVVGLGELPEESESQGRFLANLEDVAGLYYAWDELLAAVFDAAAEARLPAGTSLAAFTEPLLD